MSYVILAKFKNNPTEVIDTAKDRYEALYLKNEYEIAFGKNWKVTFKKDKSNK